MKNFKDLGVDDYLQILWRRKWYVVVTFILVSAGVTVYAFRQQQLFRSDTKIMVLAATVPEDYVRPVDRATPQERISAIRAQLESRTFLARIIEQYQLFGFGSGPGFRQEDAIDALKGIIKVDVAAGNTFTLSFYAPDPQVARDVTKKLADSLIQANVSAHKNATIETDQFVDEQLRRAERDLTAQDEKIKEYKTRYLGALPEQSMANLNILTGLQTQLASAEGQIDRAKEQLKMLDLTNQEQERLTKMTENLFSDPTANDATQPEAGGRGSRPQSALDQQLAAKRAQLAQLSLRFKPDHPDYAALDREVKDLEQKVAALNSTKDKNAAGAAGQLTPLGAQPNVATPEGGAKPGNAADASAIDLASLASESSRFEMQSLKDGLAKATRAREDILRQIKLTQKTLNLGPTIEQELMALTREREVLQQRYSELQSKKFNSQMASSLATDINNETYRIIDEANLPERPAYPNRLQIILMGLGGGIFLGLAAAVGREYLDPTLGSEHEAAAVLNLPVLICIPEIAGGDRSRRKLLARKAS